MKKTIFFTVSMLCTILHAEHLQERKVCTTQPSRPFPECEEVGVQLDMLQQDFDVCCQSLTATCQLVQDAVLSALACQRAIEIDQALINSAAPQITQPGRYCLTENVSTAGGPLVINANNVEIHLNGFTMSGGTNAIQATGDRSIKVMDGSINGTTQDGILFTNCSSVQISNIVFTNTQQSAIQLSGVNGFRINNCSITGADAGGGANHVLVSNSSNGVLNCCSIFDSLNGFGFGIFDSNTIFCKELNVSRNASLSRGFVVTNGSAISFIESKFNNNTNCQFGFSLLGVTNGVVCRQCQVNGNSGNPVLGFASGSDVFDVVFDSCQCMNNQSAVIGFNILGDRFSLINNIAKGNVGQGFSISNVSEDSFVQNNIALANTTIGFVNGINANNGFFGNYAQANGANYSASIGANEDFTIASATFVTTGTPVTWNNINAQ